ncbi:MAG: tetraacyldisaccharide 4'-kinase, partial [Ignavibacteria bacterium]
MTALKILLIPFSIIYSSIIFIRNKLYDHKIFKTHKISKPVISIGNISTGGTGKTPLTIFAAKYYLKNNFKVGIVSRGYK